MSRRVSWDDVPEEVRADLAARGNSREGATAIVDRESPRERWYFRRARFSWDCLSVDRDPGKETGRARQGPGLRRRAAELGVLGDEQC